MLKVTCSVSKNTLKVNHSSLRLLRVTIYSPRYRTGFHSLRIDRRRKNTARKFMNQETVTYAYPYFLYLRGDS